MTDEKNGYIDEIGVEAYAKINLSLDIVGRLDNGYHLLEMLLQSIDLKDELVFRRIPQEAVVLKAENTDLPTDGRNIIVRAAELFCNETGLPREYEIFLRKNIPAEAGMAGGSVNAAATLKALNTMNKAPLGEEALARLALQLGADVPFCLRGGTMWAEGIGENLTPLPPLSLKLLIVKPDKGVSTKEAYRNTDLSSLKNRPDSEALLAAVREGRRSDLPKYMGNVLYPYANKCVPQIGEIIRDMEEKFDCSKAMMTGSGSTVFGIFEDGSRREEARAYFAKRYKQVFLAETVDKSLDWKK